MQLRNHSQRLSETACSPRTLEIAHSAKGDDLRPPTGVIWDYGHVQGIEVIGDDVCATYIYHYPALSGYYIIDRVDRGDQTL
jgi:hypothetical protein